MLDKVEESFVRHLARHAGCWENQEDKIVEGLSAQRLLLAYADMRLRLVHPSAVDHIGLVEVADRTGLVEVEHIDLVAVDHTGLVEEHRRLADLVEVVVDPMTRWLVSQCSHFSSRHFTCNKHSHRVD